MINPYTSLIVNKNESESLLITGHCIYTHTTSSGFLRIVDDRLCSSLFNTSLKNSLNSINNFNNDF